MFLIVCLYQYDIVAVPNVRGVGTLPKTDPHSVSVVRPIEEVLVHLRRRSVI